MARDFSNPLVARSPKEIPLNKPAAEVGAGALSRWLTALFALLGARSATVRPISEWQQQMNYLQDTIRSYGELPNNWDGYNGHAPSLTDIKNALAFLCLFSEGDIPDPMVAGDGDVGFIWQTESSYLEVGFCDEGQISFFGETDDAQDGDDGAFDPENIFPKLRKFLQQIANVRL
ncbi:MAG: hypothetical protein ACR2PV_00750 [Gammaproteobacteria bacterium]